MEDAPGNERGFRRAHTVVHSQAREADFAAREESVPRREEVVAGREAALLPREEQINARQAGITR